MPFYISLKASAIKNLQNYDLQLGIIKGGLKSVCNQYDPQATNYIKIITCLFTSAKVYIRYFILCIVMATLGLDLFYGEHPHRLACNI